MHERGLQYVVGSVCLSGKDKLLRLLTLTGMTSARFKRVDLAKLDAWVESYDDKNTFHGDPIGHLCGGGEHKQRVLT